MQGGTCKGLCLFGQESDNGQAAVVLGLKILVLNRSYSAYNICGINEDRSMMTVRNVVT